MNNLNDDLDDDLEEEEPYPDYSPNDCESCSGTGIDAMDGGQCEDCLGTGEKGELD
ncbi:hypothetical protein [Acinetobacter sp. Tr-809]|uniref:hypothetical protein n=1 Tax=Acinetobacter sp. Tr-809 TaxID=2608324 RepID=UPI001421B80C|nr:hypothetical protein [Acinetobacter sp. Tr-809]